ASSQRAGHRPALFHIRHRSGVPRPATSRRPCRGRAPSLFAMDLTLSPDQLTLQDRARRFARDVLQPLEVGFETAGGRLDPDVARAVKAKAMDTELHGGSFPKEVGGQGWSMLEQVLV